VKDAGIYATFTIIETLLTVIVPYFPIKENIKIYDISLKNIKKSAIDFRKRKEYDESQ
jgi:hypothetical protein